jgi:putative FmdB family regulatory protein
MPLYEFVCDDCRREFELLARTSNWKGAVCPHCQSRRLTRKFSVFAAARGGGEATSGAACTTNPATCQRCGPHHRH